MYAKANHRGEGIIIPDNYKGNAFFEENISPKEQISEDTDAQHEKAIEVAKEEVLPPKTEQRSFLSTLMPPKVSKPSGILNNIGLEELLIIGVLILLSQGDSDDDILLLLFLLLFYK